MNKKQMKTKFLISAVVVAVICGALTTVDPASAANNKVKPVATKVVVAKKNVKVKILTAKEAEKIVHDFIASNLLADGTKFKISDFKKYNSGLYEMNINLEENPKPFKAYLTIDGKIFMPQGMNIVELTKASDVDSSKGSVKKDTRSQSSKSDKPVVEVFVMSYCPYGTQIEKGLLPVVENLGDKIDFKIKFVDYAMHGEKELRENMLQVCLDREQHDKFLGYVDCFVKSENADSEKCLIQVGVDKDKLNLCVAKLDSDNKIIETFNKGEGAWSSQFPPFPIYKADNRTYEIQGSPTLIINGKEVAASRDSASLAKVICDAFNKKPVECDKKFSTALPSVGFGSSVDATNSASGGCGN